MMADTVEDLIAKALQIRYDGEQMNPRGPNLNQWTDPQTQASFYTKPGQSVLLALTRKRAEFARARHEMRVKAGAA